MGLEGWAVTTSDQALFALPDLYLDLQAEARDLAASVADLAAEADEADHAHRVMRARRAASGLAAVAVAGQYGGRFPRVDSLAVTVVREALAGVSGHLDSMFAMQGIGSYPLWAGGSDAARKRWLPAV